MQVLGQAPTPSLVLALLKGRCPSAVVRSVRTVVVDPLDGQPRRRFTHVCKESLKAVTPAVTDRNAATAVVLEPLVLGVEATLFHRCPAFEAARAPASMCSDAGAQRFTMKTAATDCQASGHVSHRDGFLDATVAPAEPNGSLEFVSMQKANGDEAAKTPSGDIFECGHNGSPRELSCQEAARRFSGGPSRFSTIFCGRLQ
jgi:hypothetical protein